MNEDTDKNIELLHKEMLKFTIDWAEYVKRTPNEIWSRQQADFINDTMRCVFSDYDIYMKIKRIVEQRK